MITPLEVPTDVSASDTLVFRDLNLSDEVQLAVQMSGYITPTPVQAEIIPHMLAGRDVLAQSQTGTGKTAAFALPILSRIDLKGALPQVLVLAPTRELATQVAKSFETYATCIPKLRVTAIYGGADYEPQLRSLKQGVHVVVGTPGRLLDHIRRGSLKLDAINCMVLDEADEMLNMGFLEDVEFMLAQTPKEKQIALFSATMPDPIRRIADEYLRDPASITIRRKSITAESIEQKCVFVEERNKLELLSRLLEFEDTDGVLVFTKTKDSTVVVAEKLCSLGFSAAALNGDLPQSRRQRTVDQLKAGQLNVVVATDVAARGLDVQRISHVFNYDLPHDSESYVHRIGRTGRAGRSGVAVIFLTQRQRGKLRLIERATNRALQIIDPPSAQQVNAKRVAQFKQKISETIASSKLNEFKKLVGEYAEESGHAPELIAAALAAIAQGNQSMFVKDLPAESRGFDRNDRFEQGGRNRPGRADSDPRGRERPPRRLGKPNQGMKRFRIEVGRDDGVRPGNIVGAIANEAGIAGRDIGPIEIRREFSIVDLPEEVSREIVQQLKRTWVAGKQLQIAPFQERSFSEGDSPERSRKPSKAFSRKPTGKRDDKPISKKRKKAKA